MELKLKKISTGVSFAPDYDRNSLSVSSAGLGQAQTVTVSFVRDQSVVWDSILLGYYADFVSQWSLIIENSGYDFTGFIDISSIRYDRKTEMVTLTAYDAIELINRVCDRTVSAQPEPYPYTLNKSNIQNIANMVVYYTGLYSEEQVIDPIDVDTTIPEVIISEEDKITLFDVDADFGSGAELAAPNYDVTTVINTGFLNYGDYNSFIHTGYKICESNDSDLYEDQVYWFGTVYRIYNNIQFEKIIEKTANWTYDPTEDIDLDEDAKDASKRLILQANGGLSGAIGLDVDDLLDEFSLPDEINTHYDYSGSDSVRAYFYGNAIPVNVYFGTLNEDAYRAIWTDDNINLLSALKSILSLHNKDMIVYDGNVSIIRRDVSVSGGIEQIGRDDIVELYETYTKNEWRSELSALSGDTSVLESVLKNNKYFLNGKAIEMVLTSLSKRIGQDIQFESNNYKLVDVNFDYNSKLYSVEGWLE